MTPTMLKGLRRLFFFTVPEAARLITTSHDTPQDTSEQRWREWENGESPIPESPIGRMKELNEWRSLALDATADNIRIQMRGKGGASAGCSWPTARPRQAPHRDLPEKPFSNLQSAYAPLAQPAPRRGWAPARHQTRASSSGRRRRPSRRGRGRRRARPRCARHWRSRRRPFRRRPFRRRPFRRRPRARRSPAGPVGQQRLRQPGPVEFFSALLPT